MGALFSLITVIVLILIAFIGIKANLHFLFGILIPYAAGLVFVIGFIRGIVRWGSSPTPFRIPTTGGQQKSLNWIKYSRLDNPSTALGVIGRMALEVFFFSSLFRNIRTELRSGPRLAYGSSKWLWLAGLAFHWSFFIILIRHYRFFTGKVPSVIGFVDGLDSFLQIGAPLLYMTDVVILTAVTYLFLRRVLIPEVRYISLAADYFPLFLILSIAGTGVLMRYFFKVDVPAIKELAIGLVTLKPKIPEGIGVLFYIHLFLVSVLAAYFPLSKLMHMGGVFMSPTRNLANNNRSEWHQNPWDYPVKVHTYEEYEDEFRAKMKQAGIPVEKE